MASISETGHARNVANFQKLIDVCIGHGAAYNPSREDLKLDALHKLLQESHAAMDAVKSTKAAYDNAVNMRVASFKPLKPLVLRISNALAAAGAQEETLEDVRAIKNKIRGRRSGSTKKKEADAAVLTAEVPRVNSTSQQSFDYQVDHFAKLVHLLRAQPMYTPNEESLKLESLTQYHDELKTKNGAVSVAQVNLNNARIARDVVLYAEETGLGEIATAVKLYLKSLFEPGSAEMKQVSSLSFRRRR